MLVGKLDDLEIDFDWISFSQDDYLDSGGGGLAESEHESTKTTFCN